MAVCALIMWLIAFPVLDFVLPGRVVIAAVCFIVSLVTGGIYRWTRNPMYLAMLLLLIGWACVVSNWAALAMLPLFVAYLNRYQIGPEERALQARFGAEFASYRRKVRRWL